MGRKIFHCNFGPREFLDSHSRLRYLDIEGIDQYFLTKFKLFLKSLDKEGEERRIGAPQAAGGGKVSSAEGELYNGN